MSDLAKMIDSITPESNEPKSKTVKTNSKKTSIPNKVEVKKVNPLLSGMKNTTRLTTTENGALTHSTSHSSVLNLFALGGALRTRTDTEINDLVNKAMAEDHLLTLKILFYLRDIRQGQGERRTFRIAIRNLYRQYPELVNRYIDLIPEYGRFDDIIQSIGLTEEVVNYFRLQLHTDLQSDRPSLLAKWLPSTNTSSKGTVAIGKLLRNKLGLTDKQYRVMLSALRKRIDIIERRTSTNDWSNIDYEKVPSLANLKYRKAFYRHDKDRYEDYLSKVEKGEAKINTGVLYPYEIFAKAKSNYDNTLEVLWNNLPNYTQEGQKAIVVADTSGSMSMSLSGLPMDVSLSLACYFAERNTGPFANTFITFSSHPFLQEIKGKTLREKYQFLTKTHWEQNTNIQAVFELILDTAVANKVVEKDMPSTIYIISDMEFDMAQGHRGYYGGSRQTKTNYQVIEDKYCEAGYKKPTLVFWNVNSRNNNLPVKLDEDGVVLVSGCSPSVFKTVVEGKTPYDYMLSVVNKDRYAIIEDRYRAFTESE